MPVVYNNIIQIIMTFKRAIKFSKKVIKIFGQYAIYKYTHN